MFPIDCHIAIVYDCDIQSNLFTCDKRYHSLELPRSIESFLAARRFARIGSTLRRSIDSAPPQITIQYDPVIDLTMVIDQLCVLTIIVSEASYIFVTAMFVLLPGANIVKIVEAFLWSVE